MKRMLLLFMLVLSVFRAGAEEGKGIMPYEVISDQPDASIPKGSYVLSGEIFELHRKKKMKNVTIQPSASEQSYTKTGSFKLTLKLENGYVGFSRSSYQVSYFEGYELQDQHHIRVKIFMEKKDKQREIREEKPVIYAYGQEGMEFVVRLKAKGEITFTYPVPENNTWRMALEKEGMKDRSGQHFPYLFWEAAQSLEFDFKDSNGRLSGTVVAGNDAARFLDSVLGRLCLNDREKTDFITYWGPRLAENPYNLVHFVLQEGCDLFASYEVSPPPDAFNRLYLVYTPFRDFPSFIHPFPQELKAFQRGGFELLEWGGISYPSGFSGLGNTSD